MIVRPVDVHQPIAQRGERLQRGGRTVDKLAIGAGCGEGALEHELAGVAGFQSVDIEKIVERRAQCADIKHRLDGATIRTGADERAVSALAEHEIERADEDGFARAGLAGDGVVAGTKFQRQVRHQGQLFNAQRDKHAP